MNNAELLSPGWSIETDVIVIGSGIAGLASAIHARRAGHRVVVITKASISAGSTQWAQGGIAAALAEDDSPAEHIMDTVTAGVGLCDVGAVEVLASEGPQAIRDLVSWGTHFDREPTGDLALAREGGHHRRRIARAGGDATGAEITRAMVAAVRNDPEIRIIEHALALDVLLDDHNAAQGVLLHVMGEGQHDGVGAALAPAIILATGGVGQVYSASTNPPVATGDGVALGLRAGAVVADMEFVQFHPTVMWLGPRQTGQQPLVSEALRGEGAVLLDSDGKRFMVDVHPLADLAPRDVVAKAIMKNMRATGSPHVWLDARHLDAAEWKHRFPTILSACQSHDIDPTFDLIPVAPAQHYTSGGLRTDTWGRTSINGLFACGECACTGVHGANRLASNSLLEGVVFAHRIGQVIGQLPIRRDPSHVGVSQQSLIAANQRRVIQKAMTEGVGVLRSAASIEQAHATLSGLSHAPARKVGTEVWETTNVAQVASLIATAAGIRQETRGSHWREDFPERDDRHWRRRICLSQIDQELRVTFEDVES